MFVVVEGKKTSVNYIILYIYINLFIYKYIFQTLRFFFFKNCITVAKACLPDVSSGISGGGPDAIFLFSLKRELSVRVRELLRNEED